MSKKIKVRSFFRNMIRRKNVDGDLDRELQSIVDMLIEEKVKAGTSREEARRLAAIELGGTEQIRENIRSVRAGHSFDTVARQVRFALRLLRRSLTFTTVVVFTLSLGIGANTAIFTIVNAVLLQPLPYKDPAQLVLLSSANDNRGFSGMPLPAGAYFGFRDDQNAFGELAAFTDGTFTAVLNGEPVSIQGVRTTQNIFDLLGVSPPVGRAFNKDEDSVAGEKVVVLSHGMWQRYYGGSPNIIGKPINLDGASYTIIGVMPQGFAFPVKDTEMWVPLQLNESDPKWGSWYLKGIGRMRPGATLHSTESALAVSAQRFAKNLPFGAGWRFELASLTEHVVGGLRPALRLLFAAVGLILLIACVNVSSLLMARTRARRKELALRAALGSSRVRMVTDLLIENCVLSLIGGLAGLALACAAVASLKSLLPADFPRLSEIHVDSKVLMFAAFVSLACGFLSGIVPAFRSSRVDLTNALKETHVSEGLRFVRGGGLIAIEVALSVLVVVGAGLLVRSFDKVMQVPMGFDPAGVVSLRINLPPARYRPVDQRLMFERSVLDRLQSGDSQAAVALSTSLPTQGTQMMESSFVLDNETGPATVSQSLGIDAVTANYFNVLGIPLIGGRFFDGRDTASAAKVVIVNQSVARKFANGDAVGKRLKSSDDRSWYTIVGVVGDVKQYGLEQQTPMQAYLPFEQSPSMRFQLLARSRTGAEAVTASLKASVHAVDPTLPVADVAGLERLVADSVANRRLNALLMSGFGLLAIILAAAGIYGVAEFLGARRKREVGVRIALGAGRLEILRMLLGQTLSAAAVGVSVGTVAAVAASRYFESLIFGIPATDPIALAAGAGIMLLTALLAAYIPARRALNSDPMRTLRAD